MRRPLACFLLVVIAPGLVGSVVAVAPRPAHAYHTYRERLLDDTAYSLDRREARLGLIQLSYGILDQLQVTTYTFPWILGSIFEEVAPNVEVKSTFFDRRKLALSASVGFLTGTIKQTENAKIRYVLLPMALTASVRINSRVSIHVGGKFAATTFSGTANPGHTDIEGATVVNLLQTFAMFEWRLSRVTSFTLFVRWAPWVSDSVLQGDINIDDDTGGTIEAQISTDALKNTWAIVPGFVFSWAIVNLKLGLGFGDWFVPGIGLVVPGPFPRPGTPTPVPEFDIFVRF